MVETKTVSLIEDGTEKAGMGENTVMYDAVARVLYRVVSPGSINEIIYIKADKRTHSRDFAQHATPPLIKNLPSMVPITHLVKQAGCLPFLIRPSYMSKVVLVTI